MMIMRTKDGDEGEGEPPMTTGKLNEHHLAKEVINKIRDVALEAEDVIEAAESAVDEECNHSTEGEEMLKRKMWPSSKARKVIEDMTKMISKVNSYLAEDRPRCLDILALSDNHWPREVDDGGAHCSKPDPVSANEMFLEIHSDTGPSESSVIRVRRLSIQVITCKFTFSNTSGKKTVVYLKCLVETVSCLVIFTQMVPLYDLYLIYVSGGWSKTC
ncbi:hypothetical protein FNV43_RR01915 [Rhamnella rubrinervis]|uniref:Uncharacterized protein n=1 Tax=Rhamnella rubrinervis TaxID=2594499 RepID=A0A8K0HT37_9ROSA|nr:hypothetical protein FNV43_RR01915 [Rhamnella rubrinervis]